MKRFWVCVFLLVGLTACGGASSFGKHNCSSGGEVCIEVRAEEPIAWGEPVTVNITVTSEKDISDIGISLSHNADVNMEKSQGWEKDSRDITFFDGGVSWVTTVEANRSITFKRILYLPPSDGMFYIIAGARTSNLEAGDEIDIYMTHEGGKVYLSGTRFPITPGPQLVDTMDPSVLATFQARPTKTPYPTMPPVPPTETPPPEILGTPAYPPPEILGTPTDYSLPEVLGTPAYPAPDLPTGQP